LTDSGSVARRLFSFQDRFALGHFAINQSPRLLILKPVVSGQVTNENVGVYTEHQRDSSSMGTGFRLFLYRSPANSDTRLFFTRMTTTPSGINVKLILSPVFMPRLSRIGLGIVVCPLLVSVASVLMAGSVVLTKQTTVRMTRRDKPAGLVPLFYRHDEAT
jgi:hypothetical protein